MDSDPSNRRHPKKKVGELPETPPTEISTQLRTGLPEQLTESAIGRYETYGQEGVPADIGYAKTRLGLNDAFTKYLNTLKEEIGWKRPASADPNVPDIEYLRNDPQVGSRVKQAEQALAEGKSNFFKYAKSSKSAPPETPENYLIHGTTEKNAVSILNKGWKPELSGRNVMDTPDFMVLNRGESAYGPAQIRTKLSNYKFMDESDKRIAPLLEEGASPTKLQEVLRKYGYDGLKTSNVSGDEYALLPEKVNPKMFENVVRQPTSALPETPPAEPRTIYRDMRTKEWTPRGGVMPETPPETPAKVIIPKLPKKLSDSFEKSAISIIKDMDLRGKEAQNVTINMNRMKNYLEKYRNINNLNDAEVDKLFKETSLRADKIVNNDDLFYRQDTLPAQKVFNRVLDNIKTAENSGTRSDKVIAIDGFVNSVHQDFPMSILPRAFDIPNPIEAGEIVGDFLNFASGDFTKTKAYKNIREISK